MIAQSSTLPVDWIGVSIGLGLALFVALIFWAGVRVGRKIPSESLRRVDKVVRAMLIGDYDDIDLDLTDSVGPLGESVDSLRKTLRDAQSSRDRAHRLGSALDRLSSRGLVLLDDEFKVLAIAEPIAHMLGSRSASLRGKPASSLFDESSWKEFVVALVERERAQDHLHRRLVLVGNGEGARPVDVEAFPLDRPEQGYAMFLDPVPLDREGRTAEQALERAHALLDGLADGVLVVQKGIVKQANPTARRWLGPRVVGEAFKELIDAEHLLRALDRVARAAGGERSEGFTCRLIPTVEHLPTREISLHAAPIDFDGELAAVIMLRDAGTTASPSDPRTPERNRLTAVVDAMGDGVLVFTPPRVEGGPWRLGLVNPRAQELLDPSKPFAPGQSEQACRTAIAHQFADPGALTAFFERASQRPQQEGAETFELIGADKRTLELIVRPVTDRDGHLLGRMLVVRDVSRHKAVERQLVTDAATLARSRESLQKAFEELTIVNRSLETKAKQMESLNGELQQMDRKRSETLSSVAHDLKTPLVSIRGYAQMVVDERLGRANEEQREALSKVLRNVDRMSQLIDNLLAMARAEQSGGLECEPIPLADAIVDVFDLHKSAAAEQRVNLEHQIADPQICVAAERAGLMAVLDNLVANAIKFNRRGGRVRVTVSPRPMGKVAIEVFDTGVGIPPEDQAHVFERFFRGRTVGHVPGSGLGLSTVKAVVERHGGAVEIESQVGHGTTIRTVWDRARVPAN